MNKIRMGWICLVLMLLASSGIQAQTESQSAGPAIIVPEAQFEFKPVVEGTEVIHGFTVRNTGDGPLTIERVRTG